MNIEFRNLWKPKDDNLARYFAFLPYINLIKQEEYGYYFYIGWFNYCILIDFNNG